MNQENRKNVLITGLGGAGASVAVKLLESGECAFDLAVIDTDKRSIEKASGRIPCILAGSAWRDGSGCGGDVILGEQAIARERQKITELFSGRPLIVVIGGLGGGVATGGVRTLASVAKTLDVPVVFLLTTPFSFESFAKKNSAEACLDELRCVTDVVLRIPNDLLFAKLPPDTPMIEAYGESCRELARTALGIAGMLSGESAFQTDYAGFMAALKGKKCSCGIGIGSSSVQDGPDRFAVAMERMLETPFLGGAESLACADAAILCLCGDEKLTLGETKRGLENLSSLFPPNAMLMNGTNFSPLFHDRLQITVVTIRYEEQELPAQTEKPLLPKEEEHEKKILRRTKKTRKLEGSDSSLLQGELALQTYTKGIFSGCLPSIYEGEDLDIPAFQRRGIFIDKGSVVR